jgi:threonine dehydrogenase-like Zn-dependent dehydrogenase
MAADHGKAETINFEKENVQERLLKMTNGRGPDSRIDAVGCEAHSSSGLSTVLDQAKAAVALGADRPHVLREAILCCRKGGTCSRYLYRLS